MVGWVWYSGLQDSGTGHISGWQTDSAQRGAGLRVGSLLVLLRYNHVSPYYVIHIYPAEWYIYIQVSSLSIAASISLYLKYYSYHLMNYAICIILLNLLFFLGVCIIELSEILMLILKMNYPCTKLHVMLVFTNKWIQWILSHHWYNWCFPMSA